MQQLRFDLGDESEAAKAAAVRCVLYSTAVWRIKALAVLAVLPDSWSGIAEELRPLVIATAGEPEHPNAWGSLWRVAGARGYYRQLRTPPLPMQREPSHARKSLVWSKRGGA